PGDKGVYNNWRQSDEIKKTVTELMQGSLKGKKVYVVPFITDSGVPGVQITDSAYVALNIMKLYRVGKPAINALKKVEKPEDFARGLHITGNLDDSHLKRGTAEDRRYYVEFADEGLTLSYGSAYGGNAIL